MAVNAAFAGDGSAPGYVQEQQQLTHEPGYSVGTGAVRSAVRCSCGLRATDLPLRRHRRRQRAGHRLRSPLRYRHKSLLPKSQIHRAAH